MGQTSNPTPQGSDDELAEDFVRFSVEAGVLRFGSFKTKAGRQSPYFFNSGLFDDGAKLSKLAGFYAERLLQSGVAFDMIFGPAYKGITLAASTAIALADRGKNVAFCHDRKEAKDHGEGGSLVGAPLKGRVVIIDDVITDGASKRASLDLIRSHGAEVAAVVIAMDRQERTGQEGSLSSRSACEEFTQTFGVPVLSIATLGDLLRYLSKARDSTLAAHGPSVLAYRERYGLLAG
jgi:orotate phosphoribosyltransferase